MGGTIVVSRPIIANPAPIGQGRSKDDIIAVVQIGKEICDHRHIPGGKYAFGSWKLGHMLKVTGRYDV
jgi:hypothetical protein